MSFLKEISMQEWILLAVIGIGGYFASSTKFLQWLNSLTPLASWAVYYGIIISCVYILSKFGLQIGSLKIESWKQTIGASLVLFSIFIIINWENQYVQFETKGNLDGASNVFYGSEDGITFDFWYTTVHVRNMDYLRYLTYIVTPVTLTFIGCLLARKPRINIIGG